MKPDSSDSRKWNLPDLVRIPVKLVGTQWEYFYGGGLAIKDGAVGDLMVDKVVVTDPLFLAQLRRRSSHKILEPGTELLVGLTIRPARFDDARWRQFLELEVKNPNLDFACFYIDRSPDTRFVKISIGGPTKRQAEKDPKATGGVFLHLKGLHPAGVSSSLVNLPKGVGPESVESLNHAFTVLSERFEPWRRSHTGNIYWRMLYLEENERWYPLEILRRAEVAKDEHQLIKERWGEIAKTLNLPQKT